jgi:hypothetical protein
VRTIDQTNGFSPNEGNEDSVVDRHPFMPIRIRLYILMPIQIRIGVKTMPIHKRIDDPAPSFTHVE